MYRNTIIAVCVAFCIIAVGAGWVIAGMSRSSSAVIAMQETGTPTVEPTRPARTSTSAPTAERAPSPSPRPEPTSQPISAEAPTEAPAPTAGLPTTAPVPTGVEAAYIEYTVQKGDLLYTIAQQYNVTMDEILAINQIPNPKSLNVGQVLRIPRK